MANEKIDIRKLRERAKASSPVTDMTGNSCGRWRTGCPTFQFGITRIHPQRMAIHVSTEVIFANSEKIEGAIEQEGPSECAGGSI